MADSINTATPAPDPTALPADPSSKPQWKTSEFWIAIILIACGQLVATGIVGPDTVAAKYVGFITSTLIALGYGAGRVVLKRTSTNARVAIATARIHAYSAEKVATRQAGFARFDLMFALVMLLAGITLAMTVACGGTVTGKTVGHDAVDCALHKDAIAALAPAADTLLTTLTTPDGHVDTNALIAAAGAFSVDVGGCVLTDAFTRATSQRTNGAGDTRSAELARAYERVRTEKLGGRTYRLEGSQ